MHAYPNKIIVKNAIQDIIYDVAELIGIQN